ncbi:hypothetical protein HK104_006266 [Borealophlyctis nickersoniae]|nr:hypothetical protein HK104_006266 [Borealophlyctis nickersoniae]
MPPKRTRELLEGSYSRPSGSSSSSRGAQPPPNAPPSANRAQDASPRKRVKKEPEEKRLRRERKIPNIGITERIKRATTQRLFLIDRTMEGPYHEEYRVLGSTGNVYVVDIQQIPSCNCPDHLKGNLCKHILFVMLKVLRCPPDDHRIYQSALLTKELADLFERGRQISSAILANASVRKAVTGSSDDDTPQRRDVSEDDTCQICFEDFDAKEFESGALDYCRAQCGKNFHKVL